MKESIDLGGWAKKLYAVFSKYKYVLAVIVVGAALLLLPALGGEKDAARSAASPGTELEFSLAAMEEKLAKAISEVDGAGQARVMLTLKAGTRQVVARDERISEQESGSTTVVVARGSGMEDAIVLQQVYPQYQGALIVCPGGGDAAVKLKITEAVAAVTGLGAGRISVLKGT